MKTIKRQYIWSTVLLTTILVASISVMTYGNIILYRNSVHVTSNILPFTSMLNQLSSKLSVSLESLNSLVLLGYKNNQVTTIAAWDKEIFTLEEQIALYAKHSENAEMIQKTLVVSHELKALYVSHWWVTDVSQFIGNQPALVIYDNKIVPSYFRIQSALSVMTSPIPAKYTLAELKLLMSQTHLILDETISHLAHDLAVGNRSHVNKFNKATGEVNNYLTNLLAEPNIGGDRLKLLNWVSQRYINYTEHAYDIFKIRAGQNWNIGLNIINTETSVLIKDIKQLLLELQNLNIEILKEDTSSMTSALYSSFMIALILIILCVGVAVILTIRNSNEIINQIEILKAGIENIAQGRLDVIDIKHRNELGELAEVLNKMQHTVLRRRKKYVREKERLNEVVKIITHDMKSPLININGHTKLIYNKFQQMQEYSLTKNTELAGIKTSQKHIEKSTQRIDELINGILLYSNTAHKEITESKMVPEEVVQQLIQINSHRLKNTEVSLIFNTGALISDEFAFKFIMSTLLDNAIQYQQNDRPLKLTISGDIDLANNIAIFSIKDNGQGICNKDTELVFKMFEKSAGNKDGFGIGLACARSMSERLHGDIIYKANPENIGVTFVFSMQYTPVT